jgi:predicted PhzF superfamily epimerase YddE/YHI9
MKKPRSAGFFRFWQGLFYGVAMTELDQYIVNAFVDGPFSGNPAAVVPLESWLPDETMQSIAMQNNLSETAFLTAGDEPRIRWFTPTTEIDLCGHATLASAHVLFDELGDARDEVVFDSASGFLSVARGGSGPELDFPAGIPVSVPDGDAEFRSVAACVNAPANKVLFFGEWRILVTSAASDVEGLLIKLDRVAALEGNGLIVTAPGDDDFDVCSRVFAPSVGIEEDPVTGSAHCVLAPYWSERLGVSSLVCRQASPRGGRLDVAYDSGSGRVKLAGACTTFARARIEF